LYLAARRETGGSITVFVNVYGPARRGEQLKKRRKKNGGSLRQKENRKRGKGKSVIYVIAKSN